MRKLWEDYLGMKNQTYDSIQRFGCAELKQYANYAYFRMKVELIIN